MSVTPPPRAPREPSTRTVHGDTVVDDYAWMADRDDPRLAAYLEAENALHRPPHPPRGAARGPDRRGDPRPHQGDRPQRAGAARRLVVLRAHRRGAPVRDRRAHRPRDLPRAAGPRHRRPPAGRTGRPRRERRGPGTRVLRARGQRCLPGREPARVRGRRHRGRAVRPARPGPPDRSRAGRRRHRHRRRRRLVPGRSVRLLHPLRRRLAPVPGVAARGRRSRGPGRAGPRGEGRDLPRRRRLVPRRPLGRHRCRVLHVLGVPPRRRGAPDRRPDPRGREGAEGRVRHRAARRRGLRPAQPQPGQLRAVAGRGRATGPSAPGSPSGSPPRTSSSPASTRSPPSSPCRYVRTARRRSASFLEILCPPTVSGRRGTSRSTSRSAPSASATTRRPTPGRCRSSTRRWSRPRRSASTTSPRESCGC